MQDINKKANLSKIYTNHCLRGTIATALKGLGYSIPEIASVTKHRSYQSLEHYLQQPTLQEKYRFSQSLFDYATNGSVTPSCDIEIDSMININDSNDDDGVVTFPKKAASVAASDESPLSSSTHPSLICSNSMVTTIPDDTHILEILSTLDPSQSSKSAEQANTTAVVSNLEFTDLVSNKDLANPTNCVATDHKVSEKKISSLPVVNNESLLVISSPSVQPLSSISDALTDRTSNFSGSDISQQMSPLAHTTDVSSSGVFMGANLTSCTIHINVSQKN